MLNSCPCNSGTSLLRYLLENLYVEAAAVFEELTLTRAGCRAHQSSRVAVQTGVERACYRRSTICKSSASAGKSCSRCTSLFETVDLCSVPPMDRSIYSW